LGKRRLVANNSGAHRREEQPTVQLIETQSPHAFTVAEFMSLETATRTELLAGVVYDVSPRNEPHRYAVRELSRILIQGLPQERYAVQMQDAVAVPGWDGADAPEVDVAVLARKKYRPGPSSADAVAFIEVSHTTCGVDRGHKIPLYVNAGVPAWIVNINLRQVEFYGSPIDLELKHGHVFAEGASFEILGVEIAVSDLLDDASGDGIASEVND
jgi:Uma2 family endonuclease